MAFLMRSDVYGGEREGTVSGLGRSQVWKAKSGGSRKERVGVCEGQTEGGGGLQEGERRWNW